MSVTEIIKDVDALTMTVVSDFPHDVERVWQLLADPRKLERWWGPPTYPATVHAHDLTPGGSVTYSMTGPEGDTHGGYWRVDDVNPPKLLVVTDGFSGEDGQPDEAMPTTVMRLELTATADGTRMTVVTTFPSTDAMQQLIDMGMEEGIREAAGQMDALLED